MKLYVIQDITTNKYWKPSGFDKSAVHPDSWTTNLEEARFYNTYKIVSGAKTTINRNISWQKLL